MKKLGFTIAGSALLLLSGCASTPDPAEVCSAEWIKPRAERAMDDFKKDAGSTFRKLEKAGKTYAEGKSLGPFQKLFLMGSINNLADNFENGRGIRDLRTLASTCNDPNLLKNTMSNFMREQGISDKFISYLNSFKAYIDLLETGKRPDLKSITG